ASYYATSYCKSAIRSFIQSCFFFPATSTSYLYTLSLYDALPILLLQLFPDQGAEFLRRAGDDLVAALHRDALVHVGRVHGFDDLDRKSTRLNSSHQIISYAVFCLKKKNRHRSWQIQAE